MLKIALAGNPNSGKTTLFNNLTGSNQRVGNWPGVTIEQKIGHMVHKELDLEIVDLPGIYSLSPYSMEEKVARGFILEQKPDAIINIVDGANLERNLYLTTQLFDLDVPTVVAINMADEVEQRGDEIDYLGLSVALGTAVVAISAKNKTGLHSLLDVTIEAAINQNKPAPEIFSGVIKKTVNDFERLLPDSIENKRWTAIKLLENDAIILSQQWVNGSINRLIEEKGAYIGETADDRETAFALYRYAFIDKVIRKHVTYANSQDALTVSDAIDRVVTNRLLAIPIFLLIMFTIFQASFGSISSMLSDALEGFFSNTIASAATDFLEHIGTSAFLVGLIVDGAIAGIGGIMPFLPQIAILFFFLTILEDSGYMARAAFIMDKIFQRFGLSGKSFIPMLVGFGCTVPGVMAARTLENESDRKLTIMLTPFMSCSARFPIYALFAGAFFANTAWEGLIVFFMYVMGIAVAITTGILFKKTVYKGDAAPFIMELPPYRLPSFSALLLHVWEKVRGFIIRAGTVIVLVSVLIWLTQSYTFSLTPAVDASTSMLAVIGGKLSVLFKPLGFGTWQASAALITGFAAKEAVVSTLAVLLGSSEIALPELLSKSGLFSPLTAFAFMVFSLLYVPCGAAVMTIRKESGSWRFTWFCIAYQMGVAWILTFAVVTIGRLFGFE